MTHKCSEYMYWAKTGSKATYNLATSGVGSLPMKELGFDFSRMEINGVNSYGFAPLATEIAQQAGLAPWNVVTTQGTSMANHLAMATLLERGDEVAIEHPAYGLLLDAAAYLGAEIKRFARRAENGWAVDPEEVRRSVSPRTKLIVLTNLHNPTSVLASEETMKEVAEIAAGVGATLLVDEVYLDAAYPLLPLSAFHAGKNVVVTSSLTKVYGVSGLRCGWIVAQQELAERMKRMNDLFAATPTYPGELLSMAVLGQMDRLRKRALSVVEADRKTLTGFLDAHPEIGVTRTPYGTTAFLKLPVASVEEFLERLRNEYETSAVPGRFFEMPEWVRIGMGVDHAMFEEGLRRMGLALRASVAAYPGSN